MTQRRRQEPAAGRRASREFAFRTLFEAERSGQPLEQVFKRTASAMQSGEDDTFTPLTPEALSFARQLAEGADMHWEEVEQALHGTIRGWSFEQMAQTDLNVLRLAAFEMMFLSGPRPPVIESAVRIARKYGGDDSGRFVNGVLADLDRKLQQGALPEPAPVIESEAQP